MWIGRCILCFLSLLCISFSASAEQQVRVASGEWAPFTGKQLKHGGFCGHVVSSAFQLAGYRTQFSYYPWKRALNLTAQGTELASLCWIKTPERVENFYFSDPVLNQQKVFFHRKDLRLNWSSVADLTKYKLVGIRGHSYGKMLDTAIANDELDVFQVSSEVQALRLILSDRFDLFVIEKTVGETVLASQFDGKDTARITSHPRVVQESDYFLIISKHQPLDKVRQLLTAFNKGLAELKSTGAYRAMERSLHQGYYDELISPEHKHGSTTQ